MDGLMSRCHGWHGATSTCRKPRGLRFSLSMKGTLTLDVSSASSTMDGDRRGERWNTIVSSGDYRQGADPQRTLIAVGCCERAKELTPA